MLNGFMLHEIDERNAQKIVLIKQFCIVIFSTLIPGRLIGLQIITENA